MRKWDSYRGTWVCWEKRGFRKSLSHE